MIFHVCKLSIVSLSHNHNCLLSQHFSFICGFHCMLYMCMLNTLIGVSSVEMLLLLHPFNGPVSRTTWVSRDQKGKTNLDLNEARDDGV